MKRLFTVKYEQVEQAISASFIENSMDTIKEFKGKKLFAFIILFVGFGTYGLYGMGMLLVQNLDDAVVQLDENNEYISFLSSIWYVNIQAIVLLLTVITTIKHRNTNRIRALFNYHLFLSIYMMFFSLLIFKTTQIFVSSVILRWIYTVLFVASFIYVFWQGYHNAKRMVDGQDKKRAVLIEWFSKRQKKILSVFGIIGGTYFIFKVVYAPVGNMEREIIGSLIDFFPLGVILINLAFLYFFGTIIRSYYVHKYSEQFRLKFEYKESEWYGPKYTD